MTPRLAMLALAGLALGGCYYGPYGDPNVAGSALVGAGLGAAAGAAIASSGPVYYGPPRYYYAPPPRYYGGYYYPGYHRWRRW